MTNRFSDGDDQGRNDARLMRPKHPRPNPIKALLNARYRDEFYVAYHEGYEFEMQRVESKIDQALRTRSHIAHADDIPAHHVFEKGWRDGFSGLDTPPKDITHDALLAYERGHARGQEHRAFIQAKS